MPTREEIESKMTERGGWTAAQLEEWGVPWPPPKGWKEKLEAEAEREIVYQARLENLAARLRDCATTAAALSLYGAEDAIQGSDHLLHRGERSHARRPRGVREGAGSPGPGGSHGARRL